MRIRPWMRGSLCRAALLLGALVMTGSAMAAGLNTTLYKPKADLTVNYAGSLADYTLNCKTKNRPGAEIPAGSTVTVTLPAETDLSEITHASFNGAPLACADMTASGTVITFAAPVDVGRKSTLTFVLYGVRNPLRAGTYTASLSAVNATGGLDVCNNRLAYSIVVGTPVKLAFVAQPADSSAGASVFPAVQVAVQDAHGNTVGTACNPVTLAIGANPSGGTLGGTRTVTPIKGVALLTDLSIDKSGLGYTLTAAAAGLIGAESAPFNVEPCSSYRLVFRNGPSQTIAGALIAPAIEVEIRDPFGNLAAQSNDCVTLGIGNNPGGGVLSGTASMQAVNGVAVFDTLSINRSGEGYTLAATGAGLLGATCPPFAIIAGPAVKLAFAVQPANTVAGDSVNPNPVYPAVEVAVQDALGNTVTSVNAAITVALSANPGGGTLTGTCTHAALNGVAVFDDLSIDKAAAGYRLCASAAGFTDAISAAFNVLTDFASALVFLREPADSATGASVFPAVKVAVADDFNNVVTTATDAITIGFGNNAAGAALGGSLSLNAIDGVSIFGDLTIDRAGTGYTLAVAADYLTGAVSASFTVADSPLDRLVFTVQPVNQTAGTPLDSIVVEIHDPTGALAGASADVTLEFGNNPCGAVLSGTTTVAAQNGIATFSNVIITTAGQGYNLVASSGPALKTTSHPFCILPAVPSQLAFVVQPADGSAGVPVSPAIEVAVLDSLGNVASGVTAHITVTLANNAGGGTLSGTLEQDTVNGAAGFGGLSIDKAAAGYTLQASAPGFAPAVSAPFAIVPGAPAALAVLTEPLDAVAGAEIVPAVRIGVMDVCGNLIPDAAGDVSLLIQQNPGDGTLSGATTAGVTGGVAEFPGLSIDKAGAGYTLLAQSSGLASAGTGPFAIAPGAPVSLVFLVQPGDSTAGTAIAPAVAVAAQDAFGNTSTAAAHITLELAANASGAVLQGATEADAVQGVALFDNVWVAAAGTGYVLRATAPGISPADSAAFAVLPGPAAALAFAVQPADTEVSSVIAPKVQVMAADLFGNRVLENGRQIELALSNASSGAMLEGDLSAVSMNGVGTFGNLKSSRAGKGCVLQASALGLQSALSAPFNFTDTQPPVLVSMPSEVYVQVGELAGLWIVMSDRQPLTYVWSFGDGTSLADAGNSAGHIYNAVGNYIAEVTATDAGGLSTVARIPVYVTAAPPPEPPGTQLPPDTGDTSNSTDLCAGLNPAPLTVKQINAKMFFAGLPQKDCLNLRAVLQLKDNFAAKGQQVEWDVGGMRGSATLDAKGKAISRDVRVTLTYKKPKKGQPFTARAATLSLVWKHLSMAKFSLKGISALNQTVAGKGMTAASHVDVLLRSHQAYEKDEASGKYRAKANQRGSFVARLK